MKEGYFAKPFKSFEGINSSVVNLGNEAGPDQYCLVVL